MATEKRDRQRANREVRKARAAKADRRKKTLAIVKRWVVYGLFAAAAIIAFSFFFGN